MTSSETRKNVCHVPVHSICKASLTLHVDLVWDSVAESFGAFTSTWYEHPQIVEKLNAFRRVSDVCSFGVRSDNLNLSA